MRLRDLVPGRRAPRVAYLGAGSNVGDRDEHLRHAVLALDAHDRVEVTGVSGVYETEPVGGVEQDRYLNLAIEVRTTLGPHDLLSVLHSVEAARGRDRGAEQRWGPRPLDLDLLLYGDLELDDPDLTVPHPRMHERPFVLIPLLEVHPGGGLPDGTRLSTLVSALAPIEGVDLAYRYRGDELPGAGPRRPSGPSSPGHVMAEDWQPPRGAPPGTER